MGYATKYDDWYVGVEKIKAGIDEAMGKWN